MVSKSICGCAIGIVAPVSFVPLGLPPRFALGLPDAGLALQVGLSQASLKQACPIQVCPLQVCCIC